MEIFIRRRELWIFILSVCILGGEIGLIVNIFFTEFYNDHKLLFVIAVVLLLIVTILLVIKLMLVNNVKTYESNITFAYDCSLNKFKDISYNPASVNARVLMDNLGSKNQEKVKIQSIYDDNINEFRNFNNNIVAQIILSLIIKHVEKEYSEKLTIEKLKELLVVYRYLDIDNIIGNGTAFTIKDKEVKLSPLSLPKGFEIISKNISNIKIKSKYGFVNFQWNTVITTDTQSSALLSTFDDIDLNSCIETHVNIKLEYGYSVFKLFMNNTVEFNEFIDKCKKRMDNFSIEKSKQKFNQDYSQKLVEYMNKQFKENIEKVKEFATK